LDGGRERDRRAARERGAGAPSHTFAQDAAWDREGGIETAEARGHADLRLADRETDGQRRTGREPAGETGANVDAAPLDAERLRPHSARR
jgi:hypothetical protein